MLLTWMKTKLYSAWVHVYFFIESLAKNRSRRQKVGKAGKFAAFEKLKKAKASGEKNKYEVQYYVRIVIQYLHV